jgi:hypothetical protein
LPPKHRQQNVRYNIPRPNLRVLIYHDRCCRRAIIPTSGSKLAGTRPSIPSRYEWRQQTREVIQSLQLNPSAFADPTTSLPSILSSSLPQQGIKLIPQDMFRITLCQVQNGKQSVTSRMAVGRKLCCHQPDLES